MSTTNTLIDLPRSIAETVARVAGMPRDTHAVRAVAAVMRSVESGGTAIALDELRVADPDLTPDVVRDLATAGLPLVVRDGVVMTRRHDVLERQVAAALLGAAEDGRLTIVAGGPGTGKTYRAAELLSGQSAAASTVLATAPSGKAAGRLAEELAAHGAAATSMTLHRALGVRPDAPPRRTAPIAGATIVVVDEASMLDLELAALLLRRLPASAQLILLGDPHQLPAVGAGSVLHDLLTAAPDVAVLNDALEVRTTSRRFDPEAGIGALADAIVHGDADRALAVLHGEDPAVRFVATGDVLPEVIASRIQVGRAASASQWPEAFNELAAWGYLAATTYSRTHAAEQITRAMADEFLSPRPAGTPILATRNAPQLGIYNGDVGLVSNPEGHDRVKRTADDQDPVALSLLRDWQDAHALTVHKAQGSQYRHVAVELPHDTEHALLTRNLLYTAVTRARESVAIIGSDDAVRAAIERTTARTSGLAAILTGSADADLTSESG